MRNLSFCIILLALFLYACGGGETTQNTATNEEEETSETTTETETTPEEDTAEEAAVAEEEEIIGNKLAFETNCGSCHQADGKGVPGAFPPLIETPWVMGEKEELITIVLNGLSGEIEVNGEKYNQVMAGLDYLSDEDVAGILTYVRHYYGKESSAVTPEEVATVRAKLGK